MDSHEFGNQELWYSKIYDLMPCGNEEGFIAKLAHNTMENFKEVSADKSRQKPQRILEVGAGSGLHLNFVHGDFSEYVVSDINPKALTEAKRKLSQDPRKITYALVDAQSTNFEDGSFDRVISTCVLLHLENPERALIEWLRITKSGGNITVYIPSEPEFLLRVARNLTTGRAAKKMGFKGYDLLMAREHINSAWRCETIMKHVYRNELVKRKRWPLYRSPIFLSAFTVFHITKS